MNGGKEKAPSYSKIPTNKWRSNDGIKSSFGSLYSNNRVQQKMINECVKPVSKRFGEKQCIYIILKYFLTKYLLISKRKIVTL